MKRIVKRIFAVLIALVLLAGETCLPDSCLLGLNKLSVTANALSSAGYCGSNVMYSYDSSTGTLTLSGTGATTAYNWGSSPFFNNKSISTLIVEEGVTTLGIYLFNGCSGIRNVYLPSSLRSIGYDAFFLGANVSNVYYSGSSAQWNSISIAAGNGQLTSGKRIYNYAPINVNTSLIGENQFGIFVVNEDGDFLSGADVTFGDENGVTDENGCAIFTKPEKVVVNNMVVENFKGLTVKKDGYIDFEDKIKIYSLGDLNYYIVRLYDDTPENALKLRYAKFNGICTVDILNNQKTVSLRTYQDFYITCKANKPESAINYKLIQNGKVIAESADGTFSDLDNMMFEKSNTVQVAVYTTETEFVTTALNLKFEYGDSEFTLKLGDGFSINVGNDVPFLGGSNIKLDIIDLPVDVYLESDIGDTNETKAHVGINTKLMNVAGEIGKGKKVEYKKKQEDIIDDIKDEMNTLKKFDNALSDLDIAKLDRLTAKECKKNIPGLDKIKLSIIGYGEGSFDETGITNIAVDLFIVAKLTGYEYTYNTMVGYVPVVVNFTADGKISFSGELGYNFKTNDFKGELLFSVEPGLEVFGGVGLGKITGLGVYGSAKLELEVTLLSSQRTPGLNKIDLTGEMGAKGYIAFLEYKKDFLYQKWELYNRENDEEIVTLAKSPRTDAGTMYDSSCYVVPERVNSSLQTVWLGASNPGLQLTVNTIYELQRNAYQNSQPLIACTENDMVTVFVDTDTTRDIYNPTVVKYSVYNNSDGTWSTPTTVDANNTADISPYLYSDGTDIYVVYCDSAKVFDETVTAEEILTNQNICVSKFDSKTRKFSAPQKVVSANGELTCLPQISVIDGVPVVTYQVNKNSDIFGTNTDNRIESITLNGVKTVKAANLNSIIEIVNCKNGFGYVTDADNVLSTGQDRELYLNGKKVDSGTISALKEADGGCYWYSNGTIKKYDGKTVTSITENPIKGLSDRFDVADGKIFYISSTDGKSSNVFQLTAANGKWCAPVQLTNQELYTSSVSICKYNGKVFSAMSRINVSNNDDTSEIDWMLLGDKSDLSVSYVTYEQEDIQNGATARFTIGVKNNGTVKTDSLQVTVNDSTGTLYSDTVTESLQQGEEKELFIDVPLPKNISFDDYTITVDPTNTSDINLADNSFAVKVGFTDFKVSADLMKIGKKTYAMVTVKNNSSVVSTGTLNVYNAKNNTKPVTSVNIDQLEPNESVVVRIDVTQAVLGSNCGVLSFVCDTSVEMFDSYSNHDSLMISLCEHSELNDWEVSKEASCLENGEEIQTCKACGLTINYKTVSASHIMGKWENGERKCQHCNYTEFCTHKFSDWKIVSTDTTTNTVCYEKECSVCGFVESKTVFSENAMIICENKNAVAGQKTSLDLTIKNNPGIGYIRLTVKTSNGISLSEVQNGIVLKDMDVGSNIIWSADENSVVSGKLATLVLDIPSETEAGDYSIDVIVRECYDIDGNSVPISALPITVSVRDFVFGDANGDNEVNGKDIILLRRYLAYYNDETGKSTVAVADGADANNDGAINGKDLILLRQYMAYYDDLTGTSQIVLG